MTKENNSTCFFWRSHPDQPVSSLNPADMDESDYQSSEDEDYKFEQQSDAEVESDVEESTKTAIQEQSKGEQTERFVRTRSQAPKKEEKKVEVGSSSVDVDALWQEMNAAPVKRKAQSLKDEKITITRTFKFAGKVTSETKVVDANSAEARDYEREKQLEKEEAEKKAKEAAEEAAKAAEAPADGTAVAEPPKPKKRRGPAKRKTSLAEEYAMGKAKKMNTLDKSRLDWLGFVDKNDLNDDLKRHNKDGYVEKQQFLERTRQ